MKDDENRGPNYLILCENPYLLSVAGIRVFRANIK
jgi:hypothetical protein